MVEGHGQSPFAGQRGQEPHFADSSADSGRVGSFAPTLAARNPAAGVAGLVAAGARAEGYAIRALLEGRGKAPLLGWKIAATRADGQAHLKVDGPLAGRKLAELAPEGVIEFVPKHYPMVQRLLALPDDMFPDWRDEFFLTRFGQHCEIVRVQSITRSGRKLIHFRRR